MSYCMAIDPDHEGLEHPRTCTRWHTEGCCGCDFEGLTLEDRAERSGFASVEEWFNALVEAIRRA